LREDFFLALRRVDAIVMMGQGDFVCETAKPILRAAVITDMVPMVSLKGHAIYAFAGIGDPPRFRAGLQAAGLDVVGLRSFPDHHVYSTEEISALHQRAKLLGAKLVTTRKDFVRLPEILRGDIMPIDIHLEWENEMEWMERLRAAI
jgi:tetraacyldisaccharide 4'-kinase